MVSKKGLGKGLDSLIPTIDSDELNAKSSRKSKENSSSKDGVINIKINSVEPNRNQPRKSFDEDALAELSDSIKQFGIIQPLVVQKRNDYYEIIAGERRWRAAKQAGLKEV